MYPKPPKRKRKPRQGKTPQQIRSYWKRKCLDAWREVIFKRDKHTCQYCGRKGRTPENPDGYRMNPHHIVPRKKHIHPGWFRYDNGITICAIPCHAEEAHSPDVDRQIEFREWVKGWLKERGIDYDTLKALCWSRGKMTTEDLKLLHQQLLEDGK